MEPLPGSVLCRLGLSVLPGNSAIKLGVILRPPKPPARIAMLAQCVRGGVGRRRISNYADRVQCNRSSSKRTNEIVAFGDPSTVLRRQFLPGRGQREGGGFG